MKRDEKKLRISEAARSVFYLPLLATVSLGFLEQEGYQGVLGTKPAKGAERLKLLERGEVDVLGNTLTLSFLWINQKVKGEMPLQVAALNHRDGFFLVGRPGKEKFKWSDLNGAELISSNFSIQPLASLRMRLLHEAEASFDEVRLSTDYVSMQDAYQAFKEGHGDFVHVQEPFASLLAEEGAGCIAASVGEGLGPLSFSTVAMSLAFIQNRSEAAQAFMRAYIATLQWIATHDSEKIADAAHSLYPGIPKRILVRSVENYKRIGTWQRDPRISKESYERMVDMWLEAGHMTNRIPYEKVVHTSLAEKLCVKCP